MRSANTSMSRKCRRLSCIVWIRLHAYYGLFCKADRFQMLDHFPYAVRICNRQRGQASVEYLLMTIVMCLVLFHGQPSLLSRVLRAIQQSYSFFSYGMSLP